MPTNPQPGRYRQRPNEVDAIQWTGSNADALRAFAGIDFATIDPADRVEDLDCDAQLLVEASHWVGIKPTDWVLKFEGYFIAKADVPFRAVWEPAAPAAVPSAPADRAAILREAEGALRAQGKRLAGEFNDSDILHEDGPASAVATWQRAADLLRRMVDEAPQPETQADCNAGPGWYEVINPRNATTSIAYVHENGDLYLPEGDAGLTPDEFAFAAARGNAHRLVRADEQPAAVSQPGKEA